MLKAPITDTTPLAEIVPDEAARRRILAVAEAGRVRDAAFARAQFDIRTDGREAREAAARVFDATLEAIYPTKRS